MTLRLPSARQFGILVIAATLLLSAFAIAADEQPLSELIAQLPTASYAEKQQLIQRLGQSGDQRVRSVLTALIDGNLVYRGVDNRVFLQDPATNKLLDPLSGQDAGSVATEDLTKIGINNQLRKSLRIALAQFDLADPKDSVRLAAVKEMLRAPDAAVLSALRGRVQAETDPTVRRLMASGLALADLDNDDAQRRLDAIEVLSGDLNPDVFNRLTAMVEMAADGTPVEHDATVRAAAQRALRSIENARTFYSSVQTLLFGLSQGSILVLAAIGLAITFGVMGVINMAHGELMMVGAYCTYVVQQLMPEHIGASILVAIPVAFLVSGAVGVAIERGIVRFLYGRPLETLLATFGVSLLLQQAVRDIFTANNRAVVTPQWLAGSLEINEALAITYNHLYIILFTFAVFFLLLLVLRRTRFGLEVRAVAQNRAMARAMGIRTQWIDALTFGMGSGIAGMAGVALSQLTNVGPNLGQSYIVDSFMVVVFGGVGNLWGTQVGGYALGVVNKILEPVSGAVLAKIFVLIFLILFIQRRPRGLFPQKGRAAEG
jgi:urea transport system permease protein